MKTVLIVSEMSWRSCPEQIVCMWKETTGDRQIFFSFYWTQEFFWQNEVRFCCWLVFTAVAVGGERWKWHLICINLYTAVRRASQLGMKGWMSYKGLRWEWDDERCFWKQSFVFKVAWWHDCGGKPCVNVQKNWSHIKWQYESKACFSERSQGRACMPSGKVSTSLSDAY